LDILSIVLLAVGLAMDAFSVAIVTGFSIDSVSISQASKMSVNFGAFHTFMPIVGWLAGSTVVWLIADYDHWVAFLLLVFVGGKMIYEALSSEERIEPSKVLSDVNLLLFSVAVSIDAIAVGLSFYLENIPILVPAVIAGVVTFAFTFVGMTLGNRMGRFVGKGAQILGGFVLVAIGLKIVFTHIL
jgi:putative Mn2+ efflux pump MntP